MEFMFIEARKIFSQEEIEQVKQAVKNFAKNNPKIRRIGMAASLQYLGLLPIIGEELEKNKISAVTSRGNLAKHEAQILGCDINATKNIEKKVQAFLLASNGKFHALQLANSTSKPIFILSGGIIAKISKEEIESMRKKRLGAIKNFLASKEIGIIVSTKPGQNKIKDVKKIKEMLEKQGKKAFLFIADTIDINELENFSCEAWINTACPALILDSTKIVNWNEVEKFFR
ncbi:diphthamide synthesis protein [Candidatus Pacearchaeota archaeon]|nr:diphthamide synthesis protein [Candidatus Pacearchaeota archaeon]